MSTKRRVLLCVNTLTAVGSQPYASHLNFAFRARDSGDEFFLFNGYRNSIDRFRNHAAKLALEGDFDYLMFLDDDVCIAPITYQYLKERMEQPAPDGYVVDVVTPVVYIRSYPFQPMFFKSTDLDGQTGLDIYKDWRDHCTIGDLLPVTAIGFSCCLIRVALIKEIQPAWFVTGTHHTEDVYFCIKAKQTMALRGENVGIYVDTRLDTGHMLDAEFICTPTRDALKAFHETVNPALLKREFDNSSVYLAEQKSALASVPEQSVGELVKL